MSSTSLLSLGASGLRAAQAQLATAGHNIANASVEGYSRQSVKTVTSQGMFSGSGYFGRGVEVQTVEREVNGFLTDQVSQTTSQASADEVRQKMLSQLESSFGTGEQGLGYTATQMFNAFGDVAAEPTDASARRVVIERAGDLASMFRSTASSLNGLQHGVTQDLKNSVAEVNNLAQRIADLNAQIAGTRGSAQQPNDLLDQRDQLIQDLSSYVQVNRVEQDDGSLNLFIGGSQTLVVGSDAYQLKAAPDAVDSSVTRVSIDVAGVSRNLDSGILVGGRLAGLLQFQDDDLASARSQLDTMANGIADLVNGQQAQGWTLRDDGAGGTTQGTDLFEVGSRGAATLKLSAGFGTDDIAAASLGSPASAARSSNGNALALQNLADSEQFAGSSFTDYFSQVVADVGVRVQTADARADVSSNLAADARQQLGAVTGVNLDEEAAKLLQYQQSYQAAAKVLQVAQKVFDTLMSLGG